MTFSELRAVYDTPFFELIGEARRAFVAHWKSDEVQLCTLLSIKTGGCSEDCGYCAQSARYQTGVKAERLLNTESVLAVAEEARARSEEHTSELQSQSNLVCRLLLEKKK